MEAKGTVMEITDEELVSIYENPSDDLCTGLRKVYQAGHKAHKAEMCGNCDSPLIREGELYQKLDKARQEGIKEAVSVVDTFLIPDPYLEKWQAWKKKWRL